MVSKYDLASGYKAYKSKVWEAMMTKAISVLAAASPEANELTLAKGVFLQDTNYLKPFMIVVTIGTTIDEDTSLEDIQTRVDTVWPYMAKLVE